MRLRPFCALSPALPLLVALAGCGGHSERAEVRGEAAAEAPTAYGILPHSGRITVDDLTVGGTGGISGQARSASGGPRGNARITVSLVALREDGSVEDRPLAVDAAVRTSASGWYGFANVPPGRWRMRCRNADGTWETQFAAVRPEGIAPCHFGGDQTVAALEVRPGAVTLEVGQPHQLSTTAWNAAGQVVTGYTPSWRTLSGQIAGISPSGVVRPRNPGETQIEAAVEGVTARADVTVTGDGLTNLFFLHHSTGAGIVFDGDVRGHVRAYNQQHGTGYAFWDHGYNGDGLTDPQGNSTGTNYAIPNDNTDPDGLHYLWTGGGADAVQCRNRILNNHEVIAFKSCFPASAIPDAATLSQYKAWYLAMRSFFDTRPDRVFVVMSTPPLHRLSTNATEAGNARRFAEWLKSSTYLSGHPNVVCFDLFDLLAKADDGSAAANMLRYPYEGSHSDGDSHPNALANQTVGPLFAQALIDAARSY